MREFIRKALCFASFCVTAALAFGLVAFILFDSDAGRSFVREQTEGVIGGVLGPDYRAELGRQTLDLGPNGELMLRWNGVQIYRRGVAQPQVAIRSIAVGFDIASLFGGRIKARTLELEGAEIDVTGDPASAEVAATAKGLAPTEAPSPPVQSASAAIVRDLLPTLSARIFKQVETQLASLGRVGIKDVEIADVRMVMPIAPGGNPFVVSVGDLAMDLGDPHRMTLTGRLGIDRSIVPIEARIDYALDAGRLRSADATIGPIELEQFIPPAPIDDMVTEKGFAADTPLTITLDVTPGNDDDRRRVGVGLALGRGQIQDGRGHAQIQSVDLQLDYVEGEDRLTIGANRFEAEGFEMIIAGTLAPIYDAPGDNAYNGFGIDLTTKELRSSLGVWDGVARQGALTAKARTNLATKLITVERFDLATDGGSLGGMVDVGFGRPDAALDLEIAASDLPAASIKAFWPFNVAVGARRWTQANIGDVGEAVSGKIAMDIRLSRFKEMKQPDQSFRPGELEVSLPLQGIVARSFGQLPNVEEADGLLEVTGGETLVTIASGKIQGAPNVALDGGLVSISREPNVATPQSHIKIVANLAGRLDGLFAIARNDPIRIDERLPIKLGDIAGTAKAVADVDLLVGDDAPPNPVRDWRVSLDVKDGGVSEPIVGHKLNGVSGSVVVTESGVEGNLNASYDDARGNLTFKRSFAEKPPEGRRMEANLRMDGGELAKLVPALEDALSGPVEAELIENTQSLYKVDVDLANASLNLPWIGWRKGKGVPAALEFAIPGEDDDKDTDVDDIVFKGEGFSVAGRAEWDRRGLILADFGKVAFNPGDDIDASVKRVENGYTIAIRGKQFDARPLLADIRANIGQKTATPPKRGAEQLDVSAAIDRVIGFSKETVGDFSLNYAGSGSRIAALSISGRTDGKAPFGIDVSPRGSEQAIDIHAEDAGALLGFTDAYDHMTGGKLALSLVGSYDKGYRGNITVKNFTLVDEPRLSRLVAAPPTPDSQSLSQAVGRNLQTERATFDHASAGIQFGKNGLVLTDGIIRGPVFGSSFSGTLYDAKNRIDITGSFMPAYGLNRVFGAIPIVGQILGNGREGGLIGITYRLSGSFASPKLEINPISAIAPGIFRNIFAYQ